MNNELLNRITALEKRIADLELAQNSAFIQNVKRRLDIAGEVQFGINNASINDLRDVDITSVSNGQVLKYTTTGVDRWINGTDNI